MSEQGPWPLRLRASNVLLSRQRRKIHPKKSTQNEKSSSPCPSIPCFFCFTKEKPQIYQGFSLTAEPTKSLEKTENTKITKEIPCLKLTKEILKTKEWKDRAEQVSLNNFRWIPDLCHRDDRGSVNGGFQTVVRVWSGEQIPTPRFNLNLTSVSPQFNLFNLTSAQPAILKDSASETGIGGGSKRTER